MFKKIYSLSAVLKNHEHSWLIVLLFLVFVAPMAQATPSTPTSDFTDNNDGTVTHKTTGLTWKRCAEGQTWSGSTCSGTAKTHTWDQANALSTGGWRLPRIDELVTIVERDNDNPALNTTIFPNTLEPLFWSASASVEDSDYVWYVSLLHGHNNTGNKTKAYHVRLVRSGQSLDSSGLYTPTSDFSDNGDGSVTHKKTNLTWKRCEEGQSWSGSACSGTAKTYTWSAANALASGGWRVPSQNELLTIVEWSKYGPAINSTIFPNTSPNDFWSASTDAVGWGDAWSVGFGGGSGDSYAKTNTFNVRLVRGVQSIGSSPTPATLSDCLFNWAEKNYAQYFAPAGGQTKILDVYTYRQYGSNTFLAVSSKDSHVWAILAGGSLLDAGPASQWYVQAGCQ